MDYIDNYFLIVYMILELYSVKEESTGCSICLWALPWSLPTVAGSVTVFLNSSLYTSLFDESSMMSPNFATMWLIDLKCTFISCDWELTGKNTNPQPRYLDRKD